MSIIKHVTLQKIVARDFRYDPRTLQLILPLVCELELDPAELALSPGTPCI